MNTYGRLKEGGFFLVGKNLPTPSATQYKEYKRHRVARSIQCIITI